MILVSIVLLLAAFIAFPMVMTEDAVKVIKQSSNFSFQISKISAVYNFDSLFSFVLLLLTVGIGVMLITLSRKQGLVILGIGMNGTPLVFLVPQLVTFLKKLDASTSVVTEVNTVLFVPIIVFGILFLYSLIYGIVRLITAVRFVTKKESAN